ncbi:hypothetical protein MKZ38_006562 [Zalerion maritima]|uniref:Rhodopsin domain-containing protein n=1 Tax=Zalerion maritima TaxID=339359 RepID=A0AAD5RZZ4_9PEZI|nr:hypothetical protein MKZ38_006562 [Zalerion maritima]
MDPSQYPPEVIEALAKDDQRPNVIAALVCACAISAFTVGLRCYVRIVKLRIFGWDDWFMIIAEVFGIGMAVTLGLDTRDVVADFDLDKQTETKGGLGRHMLNLTQDEMLLYFKSFYSSILVYNAGMTFVKISILLQYRRIFHSGWFQRATLVLFVYIVLWGIAVVIWVGVLCIPVDKFWNPDAEGRCLDLLPAFYVPAAMNIATDFAIFLLPLPVLKTIQLPRRQKYMLYGIFGIGLFTCTISIVRLYTLKQAAEDQDSTWATVDAAIWSYVEICMAITVGSLPTLRPLITRFLPASMNAASSNNYLSAASKTSRAGYIRYGRDNSASAGQAAVKVATSISHSGTTSDERGIEMDSTEELNRKHRLPV